MMLGFNWSKLSLRTAVQVIVLCVILPMPFFVFTGHTGHFTTERGPEGLVGKAVLLHGTARPAPPSTPPQPQQDGISTVDMIAGRAPGGKSALRPCSTPKARELRFCNAKLPLEDRLSDLVARLELDEKAALLDNYAVAVPRLGLPAYQWWSEALHGVMGLCATRCPTSFPIPTALGATFDMRLVREVGAAISDEARALHNEGGQAASYAAGALGLNYWSPTLNVQRDPRWGRNQESPGEDPYLLSQYAEQFVRGLQDGPDSRYVKVIATCKHLVAYSIEDTPPDRHRFDAVLSVQDLMDTYLPAFRACVLRGEAKAVMCSYNKVNGVPACAHEGLLNGLLRRKWGWDGAVVSDCGAVEEIMTTQRYTTGEHNTVAASLEAGTDLACGLSPSEKQITWYAQHLPEAVARGARGLNESHLDTALRRLYRGLFQVGLFDPVDDQPYAHIPPEAVDSKRHRALARDAARKSLVLLRNEGPTLPFPLGRSMAVMGPAALADLSLLGSYHGMRCPRKKWGPRAAAHRPPGPRATGGAAPRALWQPAPGARRPAPGKWVGGRWVVGKGPRPVRPGGGSHGPGPRPPGKFQPQSAGGREPGAVGAAPAAQNETRDAAEAGPPDLNATNATNATNETSPAPVDLRRRVAGGEDDAAEVRATGEVRLGGRGLAFEMGSAVGLRFRNVSVPRGAMVLSCTLHLTARASAALPTEWTVYAEAADSAAAFAVEPNDVTGRLRGDRRVTWPLGPWRRYAVYTSPDLRALLQELVKRPHWRSGGDVALIIDTVEGQREAFAYDGDPEAAPEMRIVWTEQAERGVWPIKPKWDCIVNPLQAIRKYNPNANVTHLQSPDIDDAVALARQVQQVVLFLGLDQSSEREGKDRRVITLPKAQIALASAVLAVGTPTAIVLMNGGALSVPELANAPALLEAWYGGQAGGIAIAEALFGLSNPGGKLPVTVYPPDYVRRVRLHDMRMTAGPGRTYRFYTGTPLFPFGHGLSYTSFALALRRPNGTDVAVEDPQSPLEVVAAVRNTGPVPGDEVVMVFWEKVWVPDGVGRGVQWPLKQLMAFHRVTVGPGEEKEVPLDLELEELAVTDAWGTKAVLPGTYRVLVGRGSHIEAEFRLTIPGPPTVVMHNALGP